jgi:hypothetical protein
MKYIINEFDNPDSITIVVQPSQATDDILLGAPSMFPVRLTLQESAFGRLDAWLTRSEAQDLINALEMVLDS